MRPEIIEQVDWKRIIAAFHCAPLAVKLGRVRQQHINSSKLYFGKEPLMDSTEKSRIIYINLLDDGFCKITLYQPPGLFLEKTVSTRAEDFDAKYGDFLNNHSKKLSTDHEILFDDTPEDVESRFLLESYLYSQVIGVYGYSILRMSDDTFVIKGFKPDVIDAGSFAKIKQALVYGSNKNYVIRSCFIEDCEGYRTSQALLLKHNFDHAFARQTRVFLKSKCNVSGLQRYYVLLEKAESNLGSYLKANKARLVESDSWKIAFSVIREVVNLHKKNVAHRDLKLKNILYYSDGRIKLCDFDFLESGLDKTDRSIKGSYLTLPKYTKYADITNQAYDEFALRRMLLLTSPRFFALSAAFCWSEYPLQHSISIFTHDYIKTRSRSFQSILANNDGLVSTRSVAELLAILVLEWNQLLEETFQQRALPKKLVEILEEYQEKNGIAQLSEDAKTMVRFIFYQQDNLILYEHLKQALAFDVDASVFDSDSESSTQLSKNRYSFAAELSKMSSSAASSLSEDDAWAPFDDLMETCSPSGS